MPPDDSIKISRLTLVTWSETERMPIKLPNGNVLLLAVEYKSQEECIEAGFDPRQLRDGHLFPEHIIEKERMVGRAQRENFEKAVEAGIKIAYGTDAAI